MMLRIANIHHCEWCVRMLAWNFVSKRGRVSTFQANVGKGCKGLMPVVLWWCWYWIHEHHGTRKAWHHGLFASSSASTKIDIYHFKYFPAIFGGMPNKIGLKIDHVISIFNRIPGDFPCELPPSGTTGLAWFLWCNLRCWGDPWYKGFQQQKVYSNDSLEVI